ncbi:MAG: abortive infection family protein [Pseudomonadota bacterium]
MANLKRSEMREIDQAFGMEGGYVLDFSNRTMAEWFEDELGVDIYDDRYAERGTSKANRVRCFIDTEQPFDVGQMLRMLWRYRQKLPEGSDGKSAGIDEAHFLELVARIEGGQASPALSRLTNQAAVLNLDTISRDIDRAMAAVEADPESAVTSACSTVESVCRSIIVATGQTLPARRDIRTLLKEVRKPLGLATERPDLPPEVRDSVLTILGGMATAVQGIGTLRTNFGDAHGREKGYVRIDARIASLAVNAASTVSLFLIQTWQRKFPSKELRRDVD